MPEELTKKNITLKLARNDIDDDDVRMKEVDVIRTLIYESKTKYFFKRQMPQCQKCTL